jgi:transcriptional regulator with XRE-family HTH domain
MSKRLTADDLREELLRTRADFRAEWETSEPKRRIAATLVRLRIRAGRTQSELAQLAGWDKAYVSRLESASGAVPDVQTIARYAQACDTSVGLVFASNKATVGTAQVLEGVTLGADQDRQLFESAQELLTRSR